MNHWTYLVLLTSRGLTVLITIHLRTGHKQTYAIPRCHDWLIEQHQRRLLIVLFVSTPFYHKRLPFAHYIAMPGNAFSFSLCVCCLDLLAEINDRCRRVKTKLARQKERKKTEKKEHCCLPKFADRSEKMQSIDNRHVKPRWNFVLCSIVQVSSIIPSSYQVSSFYACIWCY